MIRMRTLLAFGLVLGGAAGLVVASLSIARSNAQQAMPASGMEASVEIASPVQIGALGTVEPPGGVVALAASTAGVVTQIALTPGQTLRQGDVLVRLDDRVARARATELQFAVASAEAQLAQARGTLPSLQADLDIARAALGAAEAQRDDAARDLATAEQLASGSSTVTARDLERRRTTLRTADSQVAEATARVTKAEVELAALANDTGSRLAPLLAALESARAALATAEAELEFFTVRSPVDAELLEIRIRPGEYAAAGAAIVTIGGTGRRHVRAEVAEADLPLLSDDAVAWGRERGGSDAQVPLAFVRREPIVRPKTVLTGDATQRVDTRVVEVVFAVEAEAGLVPGQVIDVIIETPIPSTGEE